METSGSPSGTPSTPALETFLVEWKPADIDAIACQVGDLETFLVEWKHDRLQLCAIPFTVLETFLVEWKRAQVLGCYVDGVALKPS